MDSPDDWSLTLKLCVLYDIRLRLFNGRTFLMGMTGKNGGED